MAWPGDTDAATPSITGPASLEDIYALIWLIDLNLFGFPAFVPQTGAVKVGVDASTPFTGFGTSGQAIQIAGGAPGVKITVSGKIYQDPTYSLGFIASTTDVAGSTLRVGYRDGVGAAISGLTDQVFALTTTPTMFKWNNIASTDPDWFTLVDPTASPRGTSNATLRFFDNSGDIASGKTVTVADQGFYLLAIAPDAWRPNPNAKPLSRWADLIIQLFADKRAVSPLQKIQVTSDGAAHEYAPPGATAVRTNTGTAYTIIATDLGAYLRFTSSSAVAVTVNAGLWSSLAKFAGAVVAVTQRGSGEVTLIEGSGVNINPKLGGSLTLAGNGDVVQLLATDVVDVYDLI